MNITPVSTYNSNDVKFKGKGIIVDKGLISSIVRTTSNLEDLEVLRRATEALSPENIKSIRKAPTRGSSKSRFEIDLDDDLSIKYDPKSRIDYNIYVSGGKDVLPSDLQKIGLNTYHFQKHIPQDYRDAVDKLTSKIKSISKQLCKNGIGGTAEYKRAEQIAQIDLNG